MIIDLGELRLKDRPLVVEAELANSELGLERFVGWLSEPAAYSLKVTLKGSSVLISGSLQGRLELVCCRCLKTFPRLIEKSFHLEYRPDPKVDTEGEELSLRYSDLKIGFYRDDELDLSPVVSEQVLLEIPMKPVCRQDCKGLCDQCGVDLNSGSCSCTRQALDPRLAALTDIKKRMTRH